MAVVQLKLIKAQEKDTNRIKRYLSDTIAELPPKEELRAFISKGTGFFLEFEKRIEGVILGYTTQERNVIAFFFIDEKHRKKPIVGRMFFNLLFGFNRKLPIIIYSKDISTFKNSVKPLGDNVYEWIGKKWAE